MSLTSRETSNSGEYRPPRNLPPTGKYMGKLTSDEEHIILLEKKCSEFMDSIFKETNPVPTIAISFNVLLFISHIPSFHNTICNLCVFNSFLQ